MDYKDLHSKLNELKKTTIPKQDLEKGISVIIPVYDGGDYINTCLDSLVFQNIADAKYEVIMILNGKYESDYHQIIKSDYAEKLDLTVLINDKVGASAARNLGIRCAKYSHVTFVDIDDYLSESFIQSNYKYMSDNIITFSQIYDDHEGNIDSENTINQEIKNSQDNKVYNLMDLNKIASITVCKVIPKEILLLQNFREHLRSGEDTVFYCELFVNSRPRLIVLPIDEEAIYYRRIRENSVSRKEASFDFLIFQRLEILEILDEILNKVSNPILIRFVKSKYNAQIAFMNRYLRDNFNEREKLLDAIQSMSLKHFNYSILNRGLADTLVVSYCFPPYSDTSATIVAKRIINNNKLVDVVSNNMSKIRTTEPSLNEIVNPLVAEKVMVNTQASFSNMYFLNSYVDKTFKTYLKNIERYKVVYSRAMFPISHIPQLFIKIINPEVKWIAEFSDPLLYGIESDTRYSNIENEKLVESLQNGLLNHFSKYVDDNLFNLSEVIPFALADELIFTNENQLEYMIARFDETEKEIIKNKAVIQKHPTLNKEYYYLENVEASIDQSLINLAYFGNFYSRRSYDNFIRLIESLNNNFKYFFKLHIYTNKNMLNDEDLAYLEDEHITVSPYLSFTEFLNVTTKFDALIVNDANTIEDKFINPYLPSKLSDYLGSGTAIIAINEKESILSKLSNDKLYKIESTKFEDEAKLNNELSDIKYRELFDGIYNEKKERFITDEDGFWNLKDTKLDFSLSNDLQIQNIDNEDWLIKPVGPGVSKDNIYEIKIDNKDVISKEIFIKSFYGLKNIIKVEFEYSDEDKENYSKCISRLRKGFRKHVIPSKSTLVIKLVYNKNYKNDGFIEAGRLRIKNV